MQTKPIFFIIGLLLLILSACMTIPMFVDLYFDNIDWKTFGICIVFTAFFGSALTLSNKSDFKEITLQQAFLLTVLSWPVLTIFSALPFSLSKLDLNFTDAFFEAMSGITTTGATILTDIEGTPPGILIWRALLQWIGGVGIIIMALSVFPFLRVGGMQIFKTQNSSNENGGMRLIRLCSNITVFYAGATILCTYGYILGGMTNFDSFAHALSTVSSGGFSTHTNSFQFFAGKPLVELTAITFMIISGLPFFTVIRALLHDKALLFKDVQIKTYLLILTASTGLLALYFICINNMDSINAINTAVFNGVSMMTGTGFTNANTSAWNGFSLTVLFFLMMAGGCAGSTTSGLKVFRINALYAVAKSQILGLIHPSGIFTPRYGDKALNQETILSILSFFFIFTILLCVATLALSYTGLDILTALSAALASISNVGPGFGDIVGSASNYSSISDAAKWILSACMLLGRLEIFTILVIFSPLFWHR